MARFETLVEIDLLDRAGGTELCMTHSGFPAAAARDGHNRGWSSTFNFPEIKDATGAMRGGVMQQPPESPMPSNWLPYIHVADCDAASKKATKLGAVKTIVPPTDIPNIGRFTVLIDPLGAPIGLLKGAQG